MSSISHDFKFSNYTKGKHFYTSESNEIQINIGDKVRIKYHSIYPPLNDNGVIGSYDNYGTITQILGTNKYEVTFDNDLLLTYGGSATNIPLIESYFNDPNKKKWAEYFYRKTEVFYELTNNPIQKSSISLSV